MSEHQERLKRKEDACRRVYDQMLATLLGFDQTGKLTVDAVKYIARHAQNLTFDAMGEAE